MIDLRDEIIYRIIVTTPIELKGQLPENVFLHIFGKRKSDCKSSKKTEIWSTKFPLEKSKRISSKFLNENAIEFEVTDVDVGEIKKICISGDKLLKNTIKEIVIEIPCKEKYWKFKNYAKKGNIIKNL